MQYCSVMIYIQGGSTKFRQLFECNYWKLYKCYSGLQYKNKTTILSAFRICTNLKAETTNKVYSPLREKLGRFGLRGLDS